MCSNLSLQWLQFYKRLNYKRPLSTWCRSKKQRSLLLNCLALFLLRLVLFAVLFDILYYVLSVLSHTCSDVTKVAKFGPCSCACRKRGQNGCNVNCFVLMLAKRWELICPPCKLKDLFNFKFKIHKSSCLALKPNKIGAWGACKKQLYYFGITCCTPDVSCVITMKN